MRSIQLCLTRSKHNVIPRDKVGKAKVSLKIDPHGMKIDNKSHLLRTHWGVGCVSWFGEENCTNQSLSPNYINKIISCIMTWQTLNNPLGQMWSYTEIWFWIQFIVLLQELYLITWSKKSWRMFHMRKLNGEIFFWFCLVLWMNC